MTPTYQSIFDTVAAALIAQGQPAQEAETDRCKLRLSLADGTCLKCAIGHLIPDDRFDRDMEESSYAPNLVEDWVNELELLGAFVENADRPRDFLMLLQQAHDGVGLGSAESFDGEDDLIVPGYDGRVLTGVWLTDWAANMLLIADMFDVDPSALMALDDDAMPARLREQQARGSW